MTELTLYSAKTCPFAQRTRLLLAHKGIAFHLVEIDLDNPPDWFSQISPYGKVPTLKHGENLIWESAIINEYLEETYPDSPLLPSNPALRAYARFWIDFANTQFVPWFYKLLLAQEPEKQARRAGEMAEHLRFMEHRGLGDPRGGRFWLGDAVSLVDLAFYPFFERFPVLTHYRQFTLPADCPRIEAWWTRVRELDAVQDILITPEFYIRSYVRYADGSVNGRTARDMRES